MPTKYYHAEFFFALIGSSELVDVFTNNLLSSGSIKMC